MARFLDGISARFYRGIGPERQFVGPFSKMNFFIGANNSGKSIVLNLIAERIERQGRSGRPTPLAPEENYRGTQTGSLEVAIGAEARSFAELLDVGGNESILVEIINRISHEGLVWSLIAEKKLIPEVDVDEASRWMKDGRDWQRLWNSLTNKTGGDIKRHWIPESLEVIAKRVHPQLPEIHLIPAKRQLGPAGQAFEDNTGRGLIDHLAALQAPSFDKQQDRERFRRINSFLREITGKDEALLEVPSEREHLVVHMDNKVLPLSALGTGIHEVVLIAAFSTIHDGSILCIEEPEIHLHPLLQRKLVNYLLEKTSSQYFIATHSSAFIDTPNSSIFHVSNDGVQTFVRPVVTRNQKRGILDDLGCQASDILQSNAVIWVEGPSDRIYLNHWTKALNPLLKEGIHYTIIFYGGALLRHITASDEALEEFIKLRDLNRNMAIVIDSDRSNMEDALKPHAERLVAEMGEGAGVAWVTAGREIENYVDGAQLQEAVKTLHPRIYVRACSTGQFDHSFYFMREDPNKPGKNVTYKEADKVGVANLIAQENANLDVLDLRTRLSELVGMIHAANGL